MESSSFALWLLPPPVVGAHFAQLIDSLSRRLGTPRFDPHITLCVVRGREASEIAPRIAALAERLAPPAIRLTRASYSDQYFRCVFLCAEKSAELENAHRLACEHLGERASPDFMPHLSLVYGALEPSEKQRVVEETDRGFPAAFTADRIGLYLVADWPAQWRAVDVFPLAAPR